MYTDKDVLKRALVKKEFFIVKFPGGGGDERRHTSIVVMWGVIGKEIVFVVLPHRYIPSSEKTKVCELHTKREIPLDTAIREVREETGIVLDRTKVYPYFDYQYEKDGKSITKYYFVARIEAESLKKMRDEIHGSEFEEDSGYPICVTLGTLVALLNNESIHASIYTRVALRYAVENYIQHNVDEDIGVRAYNKIATYPRKKDLKKLYKSYSE